MRGAPDLGRPGARALLAFATVRLIELDLTAAASDPLPRHGRAGGPVARPARSWAEVSTHGARVRKFAPPGHRDSQVAEGCPPSACEVVLGHQSAGTEHGQRVLDIRPNPRSCVGSQVGQCFIQSAKRRESHGTSRSISRWTHGRSGCGRERGWSRRWPQPTQHTDPRMQSAPSRHPRDAAQSGERRHRLGDHGVRRGAALILFRPIGPPGEPATTRVRAPPPCPSSRRGRAWRCAGVCGRRGSRRRSRRRAPRR